MPTRQPRETRSLRDSPSVVYSRQNQRQRGERGLDAGGRRGRDDEPRGSREAGGQA